MEIIGVISGLIGIMIGLLNWKLFIIREINKGGASAVPVVAIVFVLVAAILSEHWLFNRYLWLILIIDGAALPMFGYYWIISLISKFRNG